MSNGRRWKKNRMFRLGANVQGDLRWTGRSDRTTTVRVGSKVVKKRPRWQASVPFAGLTKQKRVRNRWLSKPLMSSVGTMGGEVRVRDSFGTSMLQRKKLDMMYGFGVKFPHKLTEGLIRRVSSGYRYRTSLLSEFELQLNVVLWRSGLVKSVGMAHDRIVNGHVTVYYPEGDNEDVVFPMTGLYPGVVVQIDPDAWGRISKDMLVYWSDKSNRRAVPSYLKVSFVSGTVAVLWVPRDGEVLLPANMSFSVKSFYKG